MRTLVDKLPCSDTRQCSVFIDERDLRRYRLKFLNEAKSMAEQALGEKVKVSSHDNLADGNIVVVYKTIQKKKNNNKSSITANA